MNKEKQEKKTDIQDVKSEQPDVATTGNNEQAASDSLSAEYEELKEKYDKLNKDYLLSRADFENYRKRTLKEKAELIKNGSEVCMLGILPIVDDLERGLQAINGSSDITAVKEGIVLIYNKFKKYLEQHGVTEIPTDNEDFDTENHEAVTTFPAPKPELKGKVVDTVQKGYKLNDKVIRFAKVVVGE